MQQTAKKILNSGPLLRLALKLSTQTGCLLLATGLAVANTVSDWNENLVTALRTANSASPIPPIYQAAIVHAAIFDSVNGITPEFTPYFVTDRPPRPASPDAAAAAAAHTTLLAFFPTQKTTLDSQLAATVSALAAHDVNARKLANGVAWGEQVANAILAWRATDGFNTPGTPYYGDPNTPGVWRSVPDGTKPAVFPQGATMTPFAMTSHSQFRPGPPPALTSAEYAAAVNEIKALGRATGSTRTDEQTLIAKFWAATGISDDLQAAGALLPEEASLAESARFFALPAIAAADALIAGMDSKYTYNLWRPYHAIRLADTDGNPDTTADPDWTPLLPTPGHQEYVSNHSIITGAFMHTLAALVGNDTTVTLSPYALPGVSRTYSSLSDVVEEVKVARIYAGFHYRFSVNKGQQVGYQIADYIFANFLQPLEQEEEDSE